MSTYDAERPLHHRYFAAAIATVVTVGAGWGVWLLWQVGVSGRFTGVSLQDVNAHGQAQIDGWVGLFIMGFALQMFPPVWHARLAGRRWRLVPLATMLAGVVLRSVAMSVPLGESGPALALAGSGLQIAAITLFAGMLAATFSRSLERVEPWIGFVFLALACFVAQAILDGWHTWRTMVAPSREALLAQVATFQAPLRDLQIHGLALCMILGVSQRFLPPFLGIPGTRARWSWFGLGAITLGLVLESTLFVAFRLTGDHRWAAGLYLGWILLAVGSVAVVWPWRLWRAPARNGRSAAFVRVAYAWLAVSMAMLLLLPAYRAASGLPFSHAYYGAIRHAVTVGFVSQMIVGVSTLVVPLSPRNATLRPILVLLNLGCFLRVSLQVLSDWTPQAFRVIGMSGVLELGALLLWAGVLFRGLVGRVPRPAEALAGASVTG
jgi:NnrS protein